MKPNMLDELKNAVTDTADLHYKGVLYGEFGTRKTTTGLRLSRKRAVLLHADKGWQVIHNHPEEFDNVIPMQYEGLSQVRAIVEAVLSNTEPFNDVDLIQLDTVSQMQEEYIDFLMENVEYKGAFREKATAKPGKKFVEQELPGMPDYHLARNKMRPIVSLLVKAPIDVLFLAHLREPSPMERKDGKLERRPNITEALYKVIARDATFIGLMDKKKENYTIDFNPTNRTSAKSQINELTDKEISTNKLPQIIWDWKDQK